MNAINLSYYTIKHFEEISPLKLQKLLYYVKVWGIVSGEYYLEGTFEKWDKGPVNPEVYHAYKKFGYQNIPKGSVQHFSLPKDHKKTINFVLECYAQFSALSLSAMTHKDEPWKNTSMNKAIADKNIQKYYSKLPFAKNFPFNPDKPFYLPQTDLDHAYILDMSKKDAETLSVYPSYKAYKKQIGSTQQKFKKLLKDFG